MFRPGSQKRTAAPDPSGEDHRRDRTDHVPYCLRCVSHLLLHSLQGLLLMLSLLLLPLLPAAGRFMWTEYCVFLRQIFLLISSQLSANQTTLIILMSVNFRYEM